MKVRIHRRESRRSPAERFLHAVQYIFLLIGFLAIGFCVFVYIHARLYQVYESRQFDKDVEAAEPPPNPATPHRRERIWMRDGSPAGRIEIPSIAVSVVVVEGVRPRSLKLAVGHIPGTAFPGESGNVGIAGHRDTFFRRLREIRRNDNIRFRTPYGSYEYIVEWTGVVGPNDVEVLQPSSEPILTLVTCYPFYYVGPAPERFIVRARQIDRPSLW